MELEEYDASDDIDRRNVHRFPQISPEFWSPRNPASSLGVLRLGKVVSIVVGGCQKRRPGLARPTRIVTSQISFHKQGTDLGVQAR